MSVSTAPTARRRYVTREGWRPVVGPGMLVGALGAVGLIVSLFMSFRDGGFHPSDIPLPFLWDSTTASTSPSLLIVLIPLAIVLVIGVLVPGGAAVRLVAGIGVLIVLAAFAYQIDQTTEAFPGSDVTDLLDPGFYVAAISGILAVVSGLMPSRTRNAVAETEVVDDRVA